jgi:hypothetical protein
MQILQIEELTSHCSTNTNQDATLLKLPPEPITFPAQRKEISLTDHGLILQSIHQEEYLICTWI